MNRFPTIAAGAIAAITHDHADPEPDPENPRPPCTCRAMRQRTGDQWGWETLNREWYGDDTPLVTEARLLAVVDPQSSDDVIRLDDELTDFSYAPGMTEDLEAALTAYASPAPVNPGEPASPGPFPDRYDEEWIRRADRLWLNMTNPVAELLIWDALWDTRGPIALPVDRGAE